MYIRNCCCDAQLKKQCEYNFLRPKMIIKNLKKNDSLRFVDKIYKKKIVNEKIIANF